MNDAVSRPAPPVDAERCFDVAVIGGGPAGASAACLLAGRARRVALIDPLGVGGRLINVDVLVDAPGLPPGTAGWDLAASLGEAALGAGVEVLFGEAQTVTPAERGWAFNVDDVAYHAGAVLVATGSRARPLPGDEQGQLAGRGVSYCAVCDGPLWSGRRVAVIGGGHIALAEAATLATFAGEVTVLSAEPELHGDRARLDALRAASNVTIVTMVELTELRCDDDASVSAVHYRNLTDATAGRLDVDAVFGADAELPNSAVVTGLARCDSHGFVQAAAGGLCIDAEGAIIEGLYAAGDVRAGSAGYVMSAIGEGVAAATAIEEYLRRPSGEG